MAKWKVQNNIFQIHLDLLKLLSSENANKLITNKFFKLIVLKWTVGSNLKTRLYKIFYKTSIIYSKRVPISFFWKLIASNYC